MIARCCAIGSIGSTRTARTGSRTAGLNGISPDRRAELAQLVETGLDQVAHGIVRGAASTYNASFTTSAPLQDPQVARLLPH